MNIERHYELMWNQALELSQRAERLHRRFLRYLGPSSEELTWEIPVDIQETREGYFVLFALPGVAEEDIDLQFEAGELSVSAVRQPSLVPSPIAVRRLEIPHGRFLRQIALSASALQLQSARYRNGCLEVRLIRVADSE